MVGDEPQYVVLFRCIQNMNPVHPYNTCYTGGESELLFMSSYVPPILQQLLWKVSQCFSVKLSSTCVCGLAPYVCQ